MARKATNKERRAANRNEVQWFYYNIFFTMKVQRNIAVNAMLKTHDESNLCNERFAQTQSKYPDEVHLIIGVQFLDN